MPIYKQTTEITKIDDVWANIDRDIVEVYFGDKNIFTVWSEYTGTFPITIRANGDALLDYRIYGGNGGVGVATENLFDKSTVESGGYIDPNSGNFVSHNAWSLSDYIKVSGDYINLSGKLIAYLGGWAIIHNFYDSNKSWLGGAYTMQGGGTIGMRKSTSLSISGVSYVRVSYRHAIFDDIMFVEGSTAPTNYIPYGYKLPMTVQSANLIDASLSQQTIEIKPSTPYALSRYVDYPSQSASDLRFGVYDENDNLLWSDYLGTWFGENIRAYDNAKYFKITIPRRYLNAVSLVEGQRPAVLTTKDPYPENYIPYQKITTPVYIGENQLDSVEGVADYVDKASGKIVRMIGEYTFTGDESWNAYGVGFYTNITFRDAITSNNLITIRFSHFTARSNTTLGNMYTLSFGDNCGCFRAGEGNVMLSSTSNFTTATECKAYLKAQYDNGTPVKISYWLKTPVEEDPPVPLSNIPTIEGETVIDYDGDPKPSQMYVKYRKRYS